MNDSKPIIAISAGDPAGIGPEICAKALAESHLYENCRPLVICDSEVMRMAVEACKVELKIKEIRNCEEGEYRQGIINV